MPRKPAPLELLGGKGPRQRIWDNIRVASASGTAFDIKSITPGDVSLATARTYLQGLLAAGYIGRLNPEADSLFATLEWTLFKDAGIEAPRVRKDGTPVTMGLAQEQMWRTLRMLKGDINARELSAHAGTPAIPVRESAAADYLRNLHLAAYLDCVKPGKGTGKGGVRARYRLISDTGPRPPMICRADAIYDPNLGKTIWVRPVTEDDAIYG